MSKHPASVFDQMINDILNIPLGGQMLEECMPAGPSRRGCGVSDKNYAEGSTALPPDRSRIHQKRISLPAQREIVPGKDAPSCILEVSGKPA